MIGALPCRISKCGDEMMRTALFEGAQALLVCTKKWSGLKAWGMAIARRRGLKRAIVAVARKLAVILHRMWLDGTEFRWTKEVSATALSSKASGRACYEFRLGRSDVPQGTEGVASSLWKLTGGRPKATPMSWS